MNFHANCVVKLARDMLWWLNRPHGQTIVLHIGISLALVGSSSCCAAMRSGGLFRHQGRPVVFPRGLRSDGRSMYVQHYLAHLHGLVLMLCRDIAPPRSSRFALGSLCRTGPL